MFSERIYLMISADEFDRLGSIFLKVFASVPDKLRSQIIVIVDNQPYNWESAYIEVYGKTDLSKKILEQLKKLEIIG